MKTAEEVMKLIQELAPEEKQKLFDYVTDEMNYRETEYPPHIIEELNRDAEEARKGINSSPVFIEINDAIAYLKQKNV
ncbi:MAG: hypothetical protein ACOX5R_07945 [bacterium]|jgi:hypothetical protein